MKAKKLKKIEEDKLFIQWEDDSDYTLTLEYLRDNCPCAQCTNDDKGKSKLDQWVQNSLKEHRNTLKKIEVVGNYAIRPVWADGHDIGLYRWEHLLELCENNKDK